MHQARTTRSRSRSSQPPPYALVGVVIAFTSLAATALFLLDAPELFLQLIRPLVKLDTLVEAHTLAALAIFFAGFVALVTLSVPGAMWLSITAGFLFGFPRGAIVAVLAATVGAVGAYLLGRYVFTHLVHKRAGKHLAAIKSGFKANAFNYLLVLRLMPGCPFVVVNLAVTALELRLSTYIAATLIGIMPSTVGQSLIGDGLREIVHTGRPVTLTDLALNPSIVVGSVVLSLIAASPIVYRYLQKSKKRRA